MKKFLIAVGLMVSSVSFAEIPLSEAAQKFLAQDLQIIGDGKLKTEEEWVKIREGFAQKTKGASDAAREAYIKSTEERTLAGVPVLIATPNRMVPSLEDKVIVFLHGGGFTLGSPKQFQIFSQVADETGLKVIAVDYRLAPENPFPAGLDDCYAVYKELLTQYNSKNIVFLGDSAGGNLCIATALKAKEGGLDQPAALALFSPLTDATKGGESYEANKDPQIDYEHSIAPCMAAYLKGTDGGNPYVTVLNADLQGIPPLIAQTGTRDALESDSIRFVKRALSAGVEASLLSFEGVWHGIVEQHDMPEAVMVRHAIAEFIKEKLHIGA